MFSAHPEKLASHESKAIREMRDQVAAYEREATEAAEKARLVRERINGVMILLCGARGLDRDKCVLADDCETILQGGEV